VPCEWVSLSIGAQLRTLERVHLLGLLEKKEKNTCVPFLEPEDIKIISLGANWNFSKGTGFS
jgi:hypothetical protein